MKIVIAGGHGQIARLLTRQLTQAGHHVTGIIRTTEQAADLEADGATPLVLDLEAINEVELAEHLVGADATVFAAGAGPGSGNARKLTVDRDGAILLADATERADVDRFLIVSSMGIDDYDPESDEGSEVYKSAKAQADEHVRARSTAWTIVRPGALTDEEPTGFVTIGASVEPGSIPRADVAAVIAELVTSGAGERVQFEVVSGETPIAGITP
ncbi:MAG: SDR family oxidoreductase [Thermoleophilia bacterium]|nr:SDR family oxidoreductase [Thermoleophilia bacterium]